MRRPAMPALSLKLRNYAADDEEAAIELWRRTWQQAYPNIDFAERVPWWRERWRNELVPQTKITVAEMDKIAAALLELNRQIPQDIAWVLRVDGHTDVRPIAGGRTNWDLSAARAIAVVQYLIARGMPPQRLVAAGFGEFQPIDPGTGDEAYSRNRRIELKLTER